jgi:signal transduction histidine kinase
MLQDASDSVWGLAQAGDVRVMIDVEDVEYVVLADRSLMTRALVNLLDNAVKFSPRGKFVQCRLAPARLEGRAAVACEIADDAGGMDAAEMNNLFRKFASSRDALSGSPGVGLGLALVHAVVSRHQGTIVCASVDGAGTVFTITLPLHEDPSESSWSEEEGSEMEGAEEQGAAWVEVES